MPSLRQLDCQVEWANTGTAFEEYGTAYGDGVVETYIVIPNSPQTFSIRVNSKGYICEGLAVLVFMDGEYQCNRNRLNLRPRKKGLPRNATEIDFRLRQKEKPVGDGSFIGREWRFDTHNTIPVVPQDADCGHFENLGTIEIIVLRCRASSNEDAISTSSSGVDSDPLSKNAENDDASILKDGTQDQDETLGCVAPTSATEDTGGDFGGGVFGAGLFDGASERRDRPNFGGDGQADGYWAYHPYHQGGGMHNESQQWGHQPGYNAGAPADGFHPQPHPPQGVPPPGPPPQKHVRFEMGGPPNTRSGPPPNQQQWHNVPMPPPAGSPPPPDMSNHGAGQYSGYAYSQPVPFDAIPPFSAPQIPPGYGGQTRWGGQGYMPYPMPAGYGYGYGYGAGPGYGQQTQGYYQGQGYGHQAQGRPAQGGPPVNKNGNPNDNPGPPSDPAKNENQTGGRGGGQSIGINSNSSNASGDSAYGGNGSGNDNNKTAGEGGGGGADGWTNTDATNDQSKTNGNANNDWANNDNNQNQDNSWDDDNKGEETNANTNNETGWGSEVEVNTPDNNDGGGWNDSSNNQENDEDWGNNDSNQNQNQNNSWTDKPNTNSNPAPDTWSQQQDAYQKDEAAQQSQSQPMPGSFPSQPRALYGPHGPYYMLSSHTSTSATETMSPSAEEEPRYDVPASFSTLTGSTHQVVPGRGYLYSHRRLTPSYIDDIASPYARFVFKYRTKHQLANELGICVDVDPSSDPEVQELSSKSKEEIIAMLLRAKGALGGRIPEATARRKEAVDRAAGLRLTVVPAPERRVGGYVIPMRPQRKVSEAGLGIPGWEATPPLLQQNGGDGGGWDQKQNQNRNSTWNTGGGGGGGADIGDAGARPESAPPSPQQQNTTWEDSDGRGATGAEPSGGW